MSKARAELREAADKAASALREACRGAAASRETAALVRAASGVGGSHLADVVAEGRLRWGAEVQRLHLAAAAAFTALRRDRVAAGETVYSESEIAASVAEWQRALVASEAALQAAASGISSETREAAADSVAELRGLAEEWGDRLRILKVGEAELEAARATRPAVETVDRMAALAGAFRA